MQVKIFKGFTEKGKDDKELENEINYWLDEQEGKIKILNTHSSVKFPPSSYNMDYFYMIEYEYAESEDKEDEIFTSYRDTSFCAMDREVMLQERRYREQQEEARLKAEMEELRRREADDRAFAELALKNYTPKQEEILYF